MSIFQISFAIAAVFAVTIILCILFYFRHGRYITDRTVCLPRFVFFIGLICGLFFFAIAVYLLFTRRPTAAMFFYPFSLLGIILMLGQLNERVTYDEYQFVASNLFGVSRTYSYADITAIQGKQRTVTIYFGKRRVKINELAAGKYQFLSFAKQQYRRIHIGQTIPALPDPAHKNRWDIFNGHVDCYGEFLIVYIMMYVVILIALFMPTVDYLLSPKSEADLTYSTVVFDREEINKNNYLTLYAGDESYSVGDIELKLIDPDVFFDAYDAGAKFVVGYHTAFDNKTIYSMEDTSGRVYMKTELPRNMFKEGDEGLYYVLWGVMFAAWSVYVAMSIHVGRYPERFSPRVRRIFFKPGYLQVKPGK